MHELGIVFHIIKSVNDIARDNDLKKISGVTLRIGEVSTAIPEQVTDCWNWAVKKETVLKDATLKIETIDAVTHCEGCGKDYPTVRYGKICPHCGSKETYLLTGNEIEIKELEVPDE